MRVYAVVSYDLTEYIQPMHVHRIYATRERAEENLPDDDDFSIYEIKEWEVME